MGSYHFLFANWGYLYGGLFDACFFFLEWLLLFLLHTRGDLNLPLNSACLFIRAVKVKFLECSYLEG